MAIRPGHRPTRRGRMWEPTSPAAVRILMPSSNRGISVRQALTPVAASVILEVVILAEPTRRGGFALDDVFGAQGDVDQIPEDMDEGSVDLLDAVNAVGRHDAAVVGEIGESASILARPGDGQHPPPACFL